MSMRNIVEYPKESRSKYAPNDAEQLQILLGDINFLNWEAKNFEKPYSIWK